MTTKTQGADARVTAMMRTHGQSLQRVARSVSLCADDADEAVQRALEIYLRRLDSVEVATEGAWMRVVVRNEALAVRKSRAQQVAGHEPELDAELASDERPVHERIESAERVARSAEALRHLKRDEAHALMLKAEGYSYQQIGEQLGWTYTKVNRCITEGRRRFFSVYRGIEAGEECERFAPVLRALVDGGASAQDVVALRPHLRSCMRCRAEIRRLHGGRWAAAIGLLPIGLVNRLHAFVARMAGEPATAQLATSGGGRGMGVAALVALCVGGAGAGGYCVVKAGEPDQPRKPRVERPARVVPAAAAPSRAPQSAPRLRAMVAEAAATPAPTPAAAKPAPTPEPTATPSPPSRQELGFEGTGPAPTATAAPPPAAPSAAPAAASADPDPPPSADFGFER